MSIIKHKPIAIAIDIVQFPKMDNMEEHRSNLDKLKLVRSLMENLGDKEEFEKNIRNISGINVQITYENICTKIVVEINNRRYQLIRPWYFGQNDKIRCIEIVDNYNGNDDDDDDGDGDGDGDDDDDDYNNENNDD